MRGVMNSCGVEELASVLRRQIERMGDLCDGTIHTVHDVASAVKAACTSASPLSPATDEWRAQIVHEALRLICARVRRDLRALDVPGLGPSRVDVVLDPTDRPSLHTRADTAKEKAKATVAKVRRVVCGLCAVRVSCESYALKSNWRCFVCCFRLFFFDMT